MAYITHVPGTSIIASISRFFSDLGKSFAVAASSNSRIAEMERLSAKSDEELKKIGLRREDIARYVFRDILYL